MPRARSRSVSSAGRRRSDISQRADLFRRVLNLPKDAWKRAHSAARTRRASTIARFTFDGALARALTNRPEWKQKHLDVEKASLDARIRASEQLPQLDASLAYGFVGQKTAFRGALDQITSADAPAWTAGLNLTWTPFNVAANAQLASKRATERAARTSLDQQLLDVYTELRTANPCARDRGSLRPRCGDVPGPRRAKPRREQRKFLNGTSSNFFVAQRQNDVVQAKLAEVASVESGIRRR